ncbi:hypothetical protein HGRIS_003799 [Hohenbuehelia grisea]|uniref:LysM domain-containing protein n=1 Tax=Hohenbuehelia grisea TaxID=104357 RepID=A0ABR3JIA2_9AGAR
MKSSITRPSHVQDSIDRALDLCLACSSSLPPSKRLQNLFTTPCCGRPICPTCVASNPRLTRYNPCIACLGGIGVIASHQRSGKYAASEPVETNIDGAVRDEDTYVIGDDEDDVDNETSSPTTSTPPPPYDPPNYTSTTQSVSISESSVTEAQANKAPQPQTAPKYHIKRGDTLQGIAFRYKVNARELCKLNNLPPSTCTTTPHLLHTRSFLVMPPAAESTLESGDPDLRAQDDEAQREHRLEGGQGVRRHGR